jgi:hypothetical protein
MSEAPAAWVDLPMGDIDRSLRHERQSALHGESIRSASSAPASLAVRKKIEYEKKIGHTVMNAFNT